MMPWVTAIAAMVLAIALNAAAGTFMGVYGGRSALVGLLTAVVAALVVTRLFPPGRQHRRPLDDRIGTNRPH